MALKIYKYFSKISLIFVIFYAVLSVVYVVSLPIVESVPKIPEFLEYILVLIPMAVLLLSWALFGPIALITLLIKFIVYIRNKPEEKSKYIKDMLLHLVCSLMGMAGIFYVYYLKFGLPFD